jgi:hypothetical protein
MSSPHGIRLRTRQLARRIVWSLTLLSQLLATFGCPLPAVAAAGDKDVSVPFPCMYRACGCRSARDCWESCCCFTARERLAWARAHNQPVPASLEDKARQEEQAAQECDADDDEAGCVCCCGHNAEPGDGKPRQPCPHCSKKKHPSKPAPAPRQAPTQPSANWAFGIMAQRCRGQDSPTDRESQPPALPPAGCLTWIVNPLLETILQFSAETLASGSRRPAVPPPRN